MLTHISIENFKGIRDRVDIELKPITLLFGPNSAGKSTILHALLYAQEVFERHNLNADTTAAGGPFINFGGFKQMVHGHNLDRAIQLGFRFDFDEDEFMPYKHDVAAFQYVLGTKAEQIIDKPSSAGVIVAIHWSNHYEPPRPVVKSCLLQLDNSDFAQLIFDDIKHTRRLQLLALDHPVFRPPGGRLDDDLDDDDQPLRAHFPQSQTQDYGLYDSTEEDPLVCAETAALDRTSIFHLAFDKVAVLYPGATEQGLLLPCRQQDDALPGPDASIGLIDTLYDRNARDDLKQKLRRIPRKLGNPKKEDAQYVEAVICAQRVAFDIAAFLDKTVMNILQALRTRLRDFSYLGPVREIPPRITTPPSTPAPSRWSTGLGAWDRLQSCDEKLVREISRWLSDPAHFNAGVTLVREPLYAVSPGHQGKTKLPRKSERRRDESPTETRLSLVAKGGKLGLGLYDVGVGIAQLLPVIFAALDKSTRFFAIEQPELHLHPAAQVVVGDLLIAGASGGGRVLLVETHSEHLLLRLLRRIRETSDEELPHGHPGLRPEHVAVVFVEKDNGQVRVTPLPIDETGEFQTRWPRGFFEERVAELF